MPKPAVLGFSRRSGVETQETYAEMVSPYRCERAKRLTTIFLQPCHGITAIVSSGFDSRYVRSQKFWLMALWQWRCQNLYMNCKV